MKRFIFLVFFLSIHLFIKCQDTHKLDSLFKLLNKGKEDTIQIKTLFRISDQYILNDPKKLLEYSTRALDLSEKLKWTKGLAISYFYLGAAYTNQGNFANALEYRFKELEKWKELKNERNIYVTMGNIGVAYSDQGNNIKAMEYYIIALKMAEEIHNTYDVTSWLSDIGAIHDEQGDYEKALEYYYKALKLAKENKYEDRVAINLGNIGNVYSAQNKFPEALKFYLEAIKIYDELGNKRNYAATLENIAGLYQLQSDSAKAVGNLTVAKQKTAKSLESFFRVYQLAKDIDEEFIQTSVLGNIGEIYAKEKQYDLAKKYLYKAIELGKKTNSLDEVQFTYRRLYEMYKDLSIPEKALENYEKYILLRDSIYGERNKKNISELQIKYDTDKKEAENKVLAQENKLQALTISSNRYITMGLIGFVVLLLSVGFLIIRQNKLRTQQLAAQFEQKLLRTQMNPHFIFNSLASIESFIYEHQPKEAGVYLSAFSRLMRLILENSASEYITLEKEVEMLEYYLSLQKLRLDDNLIYSIKINEEIRSEQIYLPPMLTQPFIENAIEHGFRGSKQQGEINILFSILNDNLEVQVIDNGIGIEKGKQQKEMHKEHKSLAMKITMERLQLLNKSKRKKLSFTIIDLANEQTGNTGTKIVFLIPLY